LSKDIETSAIRTCRKAALNDLGWRTLGSVPGIAVDHGHGVGVGGLLAQLAPHLPADPQQQEAAGQQQADHAQQPGGDQGEGDPQHDRRAQAVENDLLAVLGRQAAGSQAHGHGVVAGQDQVDHQNLQQSGQRTLQAAQMGRQSVEHVSSMR
jgi:hypothetical protein